MKGKSAPQVSHYDAEHPMRQYMHEIERIPLLNRQQEIDLANAIQHGSDHEREEARATLIESNLRLVVKIAHEFKNQGLPLRDLVSTGNLGLIRAVEKFSAEHGARFSTYAIWWIKQAIRRALDNQTRTIRIPVQTSARLKKIKYAIKALAEKFEREPTSQEIADELGFSLRTIKSLRLADLQFISLDETIQEDEGKEYSEIIPDMDAETPDVMFGNFDSLDQLHEILENLDERERIVLTLRFGLDDNPPKTLSEVGEVIGRTRERVRQIENRALVKIEKMLHDD